MLELDPAGATAERVRDAKRRLAKLHHPDVVAGGGGGAAAIAEASTRLAEVNLAADLALGDLALRGSQPPRAGHLRTPPRWTGRGQRWAKDNDDTTATFTVGSLPVDAFELVLLGFSAIGDPKVVDEPYLLEGQVDDPFLGAARVELAPEAGGSIVTVTTWPNPRATTPAPTAGEVAGRLLWEVRNLEGL